MLFSERFARPVIVTRHAAERMRERAVSEAELLEVIDTGETIYRDAARLWAFKALRERDDNLVCAVLILDSAVVVKTVMHRFEIKET